MNKQYRPNIIRGGIALPLGNNYYFMRGRKHKQGGIDVGKDLEVEDGEIMKVSSNDVKVFSAVPFLNGKSPVEKLLGGENPNKVFAQQEIFKKVNKIKDDGTKAQLGIIKSISEKIFKPRPTNKTVYKSIDGNIFNTKNEAIRHNKEYKVLQKIGYIGGNTIESRNKYYKNDKEFTNVVDSIAKSHGLPYQVLRASIANEGYIDETIRRMNDNYKKRKENKPSNYKNVIGYNALNNDIMDAGYGLFGNDDSGTYYDKRPEVKKIIDDSNVNFVRAKNINELGRTVNTIEGDTTKDNLIIHSAILSSFRNDIIKQHPDWNEDQINNYTLYRFNYGPYAKGDINDVMKRKKFNANNYKQMGGKANIYRIDSNGKTSWGMNVSTGKDSKARKKALLGKSRKNVVTDEYYFPTEQDVLGVGNYDGTNDYMDVNRKIHSPIKKYSNSLKSRYFDIYNEDREGFYNFNINKTKSENINTQKNKIDVLGVGNKTKSELKRNNSTGNISKVNTNSHDYIPKYIDSKITFNYTPKTIKAPKNVIPTIKQYSSKDISDKHNNFNTNGKSILNDFTTSNYIGLGTNVVGSIISNLINRNTLNKMKYSNQPIPKVARKLKTNYNINPQLDTIREQLNKSLTDVDQNTTSSSTALNRKNRLRLANIMNTNQLFGTKENVETELINKDRLNQQNIANSNVDDYNKWVAGKTTFKNTILEKQGENNVGLVQNIAQGVSNTLSNIEKRKATQNNIIAILAANPNVNPEYLRILGADWVTDKMIANWKRANNK